MNRGDRVTNPPNLGYRLTSQYLAPFRHKPVPKGSYDIFPSYHIGSNKIEHGYDALARRLIYEKTVILDGYIGVIWEDVKEHLDKTFNLWGIRAGWQPIEAAWKSEEKVNRLIEPYLGGEDPIFGFRFPGELVDFFETDSLGQIQPDASYDLNIVYGCGAALSGWDGILVYLDVPKNEIQFRSRAGVICNLGSAKPTPPKQMYKRFYFIDWVVLNRFKSALSSKIDLFVDAQRLDEPMLIDGETLRQALQEIGQSYFRVRPWFEPGPWGGQWIKERIPQLAKDVPNYAWSFELIVPENGLMLESEEYLLECSFDMLMYQGYQDVLGDFAEYFGFEFPVRFDFLDTFEGGNLSVQCHPRPQFIRQQFGENFTQDETYYILDCAPGARVYLGFQEEFDPEDFRDALEISYQQKEPMDVDRFVHSEPANKHDLFLIPNGTIHCSGKDNLVLEISATPYIFTFKMYDWMRMDLEGRPRPLNIERAFENLYFHRKGKQVQIELVSKPSEVERGEDWRIVHLPTHREHFYDVKRVEFDRRVNLKTRGSPQIMSLVEGTTICLQTKEGKMQRFDYAETFVVPAAAEEFSLINEGDRQAWVVIAYLKPEWFTRAENAWLRAPADMLPPES